MDETKRSRSWIPFVVAAAVLAVIVAGGAIALRRPHPPAPAVSTGTVSVNTNPAGAQIVVDGEERGTSPLTLTLRAGTHVMEVRGAGEPRSVTLTVEPGGQSAQYLELPRSVATAGRLRIRTEPAGARVSVDGVARGTSPLTIDDLAPGDHVVGVEGDLGSVKQGVTIEAGVTASLVVPLATPDGAPVSGWVSVSTPVDVQLYENGQLLGTSQSERIMVSAGKHDVEIVNETLGYRAARTIQVAPGKVTPIKTDWPNGTVALNAIPWADVSVDGESVGETPIGNISVPIGPHEILFRHPEFGERRHAVLVTLKAPVRLSVDMRSK